MNSISDIIINYIKSRRIKIKKNYLGELGRFFREGGNELILDTLILDSNSLVLDVGAYDGLFADSLSVKFGNTIICLEPNIISFNKLTEKYKNNKRIKILKQALWSSDGFLDLINEGISSGFFIGDKKKYVQVETIDVANFLIDYKSIDLIKLNVEGAEYEILERIIKTNNLSKFKSLLIQFHPIDEESKKRREAIRQALKDKNFKEVYNFEFVWEYWIKN
jgi:FkbM family methyltransferase